MMTKEQIIDFAESSAFAVFDEVGNEAEHRENIRDTLNEHCASEYEAAAFDAFGTKLAALRGVAPAREPVAIVKATRESMNTDARRFAAGVSINPRRAPDDKLRKLDAALAARAA